MVFLGAVTIVTKMRLYLRKRRQGPIFGTAKTRTLMSIRKNILIAMLALFGFGAASSLSAQKIAVVDVERILNSITEYQDAQRELDELAARWASWYSVML